MLKQKNIELTPELKMLLLPTSRSYSRNSVDNLNQTLIVASDVVESAYGQLYGTLENLTALDDECELFQGDMQLNNDIILAASLINHIQRRIDKKLVDANPHILDVQLD
ncbi:hypothetical protein [Companilactobacillus kedongensis]|uniref:hypothetical protein n=1 Tax=Companilactobacillus kedongensis TaxID=2486004 RepID=UPI000F76C7B8|nr:hypothetical protein [Companilactobacillus kedongensis]